MDRSKILILIVGILSGFIIGFLFANSQNRKQVEELNNEITNLKSVSSKKQNQNNPDELTKEEIKSAISKADQNPNDLELQQKVGTYLYQYAASQRDSSYLTDVARILKRAAEGKPKEYELFVTLGNVLFDLWQNGKNNNYILDARVWYQKALAIKSDDPNVRTDLGLTYFFAAPAEPEKAIVEFRKSLQIDIKHEPTLQNLIQALIMTKQFDEAQKRIEELRNVNPSNTSLTVLEEQLSKAKG